MLRETTVGMFRWGIGPPSSNSLIEHGRLVAALPTKFDGATEGDAVTGERDSNGRTFLDVSFEQVGVEADTSHPKPRGDGSSGFR